MTTNIHSTCAHCGEQFEILSLTAFVRGVGTVHYLPTPYCPGAVRIAPEQYGLQAS